ANSQGDPVFAIADGEIISSGWSNDAGYYLILHIEALGERPEMWAFYGHLDREELPHSNHNEPIKVLAGQQIGKTGPIEIADPNGTVRPNGVITEPHLHLDLRKMENESSNRDDHINPCELDIMKNSYPALQCNNPDTSGATP